jgi:hypothetical protein
VPPTETPQPQSDSDFLIPNTTPGSRYYLPPGSTNYQ